MKHSNKVGVLLATAAAVAFSLAPVSTALAKGKTHRVLCSGINSCKGKNVCKAENGCKGKNDCKGKATVWAKSEKACTDKGGTVVHPAAPAHPAHPADAAPAPAPAEQPKS